MLSRRGLAAALVLCLPLLAAAQTAVVTTPHVRAELLAHAPEGVGPGKPVWLGLSLQHAPHWHTYWKNPGDSGLPTTLAWQLPAGVSIKQIEALYAELKADERARTLLETYKEEGIRCLRDLENPNLKGLLRRVLGKIFNDTEIKGWCKEFEAKNGLKVAPVEVVA